MSFKSSLKRLATAASVAALTVGVSFAAPAQKASAQLSGAGATSVFPLTGNSDDGSFPGPIFVDEPVDSYRSIGSGAGRAAFINGEVDFAATDVASNQSLDDLFSAIGRENIIAVTPADITVVFPFNVPGFSGTFNTPEEVCGVIAGTIHNWSEIGGPDLPVSRVVRGDVSGTSAVFDSEFVQPVCGFSILDGDGNVVDNPTGTDQKLSPVIRGQGSQGVLEAVASSEGHIGYSDRSTSAERGFTIEGGNVATFGPTGGSEIAVGPVYFVFRHTYTTTQQQQQQAVDEEGNPVFDEEGNPVFVFDEEGNPVFVLDENGNPVLVEVPDENKINAARIACQHIINRQAIVSERGYADPTGPNDDCDAIGRGKQ